MGLKERQEQEQPKVEEQPGQPTAEDVEMDKLRKQMEVDTLTTDSITAKTRRLAAEKGYTKVESLLAREAGIIEKEAELEEEAIRVSAIVAKNTEILARTTEAKTQVSAERQELKADIKRKQAFELFFEASGSKWKNEQVEKELKWLFVKFAGIAYGTTKDDEAWRHVSRLQRLWQGLGKEGDGQ